MADAPTQALGTVLRQARDRLRLAGIIDAAIDARLIVEHYSETTRTQAVASPDLQLDDGVVAAIDAAVDRRVTGEPVHRIFGARAFHGLMLQLSTDTLEPRPDTETLVDAMLPHARDCVDRTGRCRILDLGTGTGAIALALLAEIPLAQAVGTDVSEGALATASLNSETLGLSERFATVVSDWFDRVNGQFDLIVSNPPYIDRDALRRLDRDVLEHDPIRALDGGQDGLNAYRALAAKVTSHLAPRGVFGLEIGYDQRDRVTDLMTSAGLERLSVHADLGGHDRALLFLLAPDPHGR